VENQFPYDPAACPLCGGDNRCGNLAGKPSCWCSTELFPQEIFAQVPPELLRKACICPNCLTRFKEQQQS